MRRRRRSMFASTRRSPSAVWLEPGRGAPRRRGGRRRGPSALSLLAVALVAAAGLALGLVVRHHHRLDQQRDAATAYARAWSQRDPHAMWATLSGGAQRAYPQPVFERLVRAADAAATVRAVRVGAAGDPRGGVVTLRVAVPTRMFGTLRATMRLPVGSDGVRWTPALRLPGLRSGEAVRRRTLTPARRGAVLDAAGRPLVDDPVLAPFAAGLRRRYAVRLDGHPGAELRFGARSVARVGARDGRSVHATVDARIQAAAQRALGARLGGIAVLRPRDGSVRALAGLAVSAPQPPGSTFKIITASGVLSAGLATPATTFPVRRAATLSGVRLANASDEACGGTLARAFADSCNSVFAPLGARLGARRLVARARAFGFDEQPRVPAARPSTLPDAGDLRDALAVGSSAIGQGKVLATPLGMASVAATVGRGGMRAQPRVVSEDPVHRRRAVSLAVAAQVRAMMVGVVRSGTGRAAALPGVTVAGKTGTAELRTTAGGKPDPRNTDAWFVAFAPAAQPRVAVAVMLVGAGAGGKAAAPLARQVLAAALT